MKIAITSSDGVTVDQHFGKADCFYIYEAEHGKLNFVEKRDVVAYCKSSVQSSTHNFDNDKFISVFEALKDCMKIYTKQIGDTPLQKLKEEGIEVQLCGCEIDSISGCSGNCKH